MKAAAIKAFAENDIDNFIIATIPGGIEAQEKSGQNSFVNNSTLPKDAPWEKLEQIGIVVSSDADDLFKNCTLPQGWKKVATDHSMWSNLVDEKGRIRASIFYKAAFYDRSAHLSLNKRFSIGVVPEDFYKSDQSYEDRQSGKWAAVVNDCNKVVFSTDWIELPSYSEYEKRDCVEKQLTEKALTWLNEKYPGWNDELAYWD